MDLDQKIELRQRSRQKLAVDRVSSSMFAQSEARMLQMLLRERAYRRLRGLAMYQPMPHQLPFHQSNAPERIVFGSNRSGKTTSAAVEVAWAVTGQHPYLDYPKTDGRLICVAKDGMKIGEVMYKKLFRPGAYRIVFDKKRGWWRRWEPDGRDEHIPRRETRPSLPLIPQEMIKKIAWEDKAKNWPKLITLTNSWEMLFFTSAGKPIEGVDVDLCWFDEEIYSGAWYSEMSARLIDRAGRFIWSATPDLATDEFFNLYEEANKLKGTVNPRIESFFLHMDKNAYLSEQQRAVFKAKLANNPEKYKVKVEGQFLVSSQRVYPNFNQIDHGCEMFVIPDYWTRYIILDPGFAHCFATFVAVPPPSEPEIGHCKFVYDELYTQGVDCNEFTRTLEMKGRGQQFEAFLIDDHGGRRGEVGGKSIAQQFADAFRKHHLKSISTGHGFRHIGQEGWEGHTPLLHGVQDVRSWLWKEQGKRPVLQIFHALCPSLMEQMKNYKNKVDQKTQKPTDKPDQTRWSHGPDTIRYAKMDGCAYVEPRVREKPESSIVKYFKNKMKARAKNRRGGVVLS